MQQFIPHKVAHSPHGLATLLITSVWLFALPACVEQEEPVEEESSEESKYTPRDSRYDVIQPSATVVDVDESEPTEPVVDDPSRYPMFETVRFVKRYKSCTEPVCMLDLRFGLRGGTMASYQRGTNITRDELEKEDRDRLREIVSKDSEFGQLLFSDVNIPCEMISPSRVDYEVELELTVYTDSSTLEYFTHSVSHCYANSVDEITDEFTDFVTQMNIKY